ncbi:MAG: hypothetical protein MUC72_01635 [Acidobacteria bacterium]|jgi:hypothetical protein|nr:hypothetical protein [Acidobacteriota bacterium]
MIADQGTLNETAPAKLLLALYEVNQTGILYFRQNEILKVFYLNRGKISWAISSDEADRIDHVLLAKKLVIPEVLAPYQSGNKISESFGKILVENGVLSLDGLIQATREQVRLIACSVLRWSSGNYQLVQEPPPNRLVSLDVSIPVVVAHYIMTQMDVNIVWEELGSLSGELQQSQDPGKRAMYALDGEQQEVFSRFQTPQRLETVLLDFPAERKYRILKILYFFLLTGMLKKREAEKVPGLDFKELDSLFGQSPASAPVEVDIEMPAMIDETAIQDMPLAELPEISVESEGGDGREDEALAMPALPDLMPPEPLETEAPAKEIPVERSLARERSQPQPFLRPEKQKPRWLSISFLSILLAAVLIGAFLWFTRPADPPEKAVAPAATARPRAAQTSRPGVPAGIEPVPAPSVSTANTQATGSPAATEPAAQETPPASKPAAPEPRPITAGNAAGEAQARQRFAAGNFHAAGAIWRSEMLASGITHSILLELDCLKASVRTAYAHLEDKSGFFLLNKTNRDGRACWLVLWGRFRTADEAALNMKLVPEYFMKQSHPPSVIELAPYL